MRSGFVGAYTVATSWHKERKGRGGKRKERKDRNNERKEERKKEEGQILRLRDLLLNFPYLLKETSHSVHDLTPARA